MMVTGTRRRRHNQRQQHQECREPEHRPEHPFRRFFDHGALTPEAIEIVGLLLKNVRELQEFAALGSETASPGYFAEACGDLAVMVARLDRRRASGGDDLNQICCGAAAGFECGVIKIHTPVDIDFCI
jgi:hypothetical protein